MSASSTAPASPALLRLGVLGGWLLFTLMVIAISWAGAVVRGRPPGLGGMIVWNLGWLWWAGGTFLVAALARRFPFERGKVARGLMLHLPFGILVGVALLGLEFLVARLIEFIWPGAPRANPFLGFVIYKLHVYFLIYWMILGATRAYDLQAKFRATELRASQLDAQLAQAQLQALQTQLQPHFLFNTHHAIISLMLKPDPAAAIKMLTQLSDLLRMTLRQTHRQMTSLREELEALDLYLGIQHERYRDRLQVERQIAPVALAAEVPALLLQPIVENALKHGIDPLPGGGILRIRAAVAGGKLQLAITDNGPGFPAAFSLRADGSGIGLENTRQRLARLYGSAQTLELRNVAPAGADVQITLPWRAHQPASAEGSFALARADA